jgi:DNA repair ATPase RecN
MKTAINLLNTKKRILEGCLNDPSWAPTDTDFHKQCRTEYQEQVNDINQIISIVEKETNPTQQENTQLLRARYFIGKIPVWRSNFDHISQYGRINGSLLVDIEKAMDQYSSQYKQRVQELEKDHNNLVTRIRETDLVMNELFRSMQRISNTGKFLECDNKRLEKAKYIQSKYFDIKDCLRIERSGKDTIDREINLCVTCKKQTEYVYAEMAVCPECYKEFLEWQKSNKV